jgi:hypothetical protein
LAQGINIFFRYKHKKAALISKSGLMWVINGISVWVRIFYKINWVCQGKVGGALQSTNKRFAHVLA